MSPAAFGVLADLVLVAHFGIVVFVVGGLLLRVAGLVAGWRFTLNRGFRAAHLVAVAIIVMQAWGGVICPLTRWENALRARAGEPVYESGFVAAWLHRLLFFDWPSWVFTVVYTIFGAVVALVFVAESRRARSARSESRP